MEAMETTVYHQPRLSGFDAGIVRSPGPGLGNLMFPISRALIGREAHGGTFVYPTIRQLKFGTFLRRELDKRTYGDLFRTRTREDWRSWIKAGSLPSVNEDQYDGRAKSVTVHYTGLGQYFYDIMGHRDLIGAWIAANAQFRGLVDASYDIGIHVRLGDFVTNNSDNSASNTRLPIEWYRQAIAEAKNQLSLKTPRIALFTDADVDEVTQMLGLVGVNPDPSHNAVTAIINLSKAKIIVASRSTFSMWAAYLGDVPSIWDKSFDLARYFPLREGIDFCV